MHCSESAQSLVQITHDVLVQVIYLGLLAQHNGQRSFGNRRLATGWVIAASASHVDKALSSGINEFTYNVQDF